MLKKIISGGQTGIDKMGLLVGAELGFETGGTAPAGFITENGTDYTLRSYGLKEISAEDAGFYQELTQKRDKYVARTFVNTRDSDGTVYFSTDNWSPGSKTTRRGCNYHNKPFILNPNVDSLCKFIDENNIEVLNVAGNRASKLSAVDSRRFHDILRTALLIYSPKR